MSAKPETSLRYLKRFDSKMNKLLALATRYVEGAPPVAAPVSAATEPEELPFYFQSNAAAAAAANAAAANANAPAAAAAAAAANANAPAAAAPAAAASVSKLNNWNRHVAEVLQEMREAKWKNPTSGKNATRTNAMKEASRRKAETNSNYAARTRSRREKRNKQLAKKGLSAVAEEAASNLPAATSGNLVATAAAANLPTAVNLPAAAATAAEAAAGASASAAAASAAAAGANVAPGPIGPPRKGNGRPPPSMYKSFKVAPSIPKAFVPNGPNTPQSYKAAKERLETLLQDSSLPAEKRATFERLLNVYTKKLADATSKG